jgi:hypothetical protein
VWNGYHEEAGRRLTAITRMAGNFVFLNGSPVEGKTARFVELCEAFATYIRNNQEALIDYGRRQRDGKPISTPRAEGMANHMVNARMNKRQHMRWSPRGAHWVLQVRAAVLNGHFGATTVKIAACCPRFIHAHEFLARALVQFAKSHMQ